MQQLSESEIAAHDDQREVDGAVVGKLVELLGRHLRGLVLDAGGGSATAQPLLEQAGCEVLVMDLSRPMLAVAHRRHPVARLVQADLVELPFPVAAFDGVHVANVLHLVPDWRGALGELARVLRTGGGLVIRTGARPVGLALELSAAAHAAAAQAPRNDLADPEQLDHVLTTWGVDLVEVAQVRSVQSRSLRAIADRLALNPFQLTGTPTERRAAADAGLHAVAGHDVDVLRPLELDVHYRCYTRSS